MNEVELYNEDCVIGMSNRLAQDSIDLCVTSIPFNNLFVYTALDEDVGNNPDAIDLRSSRFGLNMRFVIVQLHRVMKAGTNVCIHIQQLLRYKNVHGQMGRRDFRGTVIDLFEYGGFEWKGEFAIAKNPQAMAQRLNLHCLMFQTGRRNGRNLAPAVNDYVLIFQKPGESGAPVPCLYDKKENPYGWVRTEEWIRDASGIWNDIRETDVLEGYRAARESDDEKHVCPLQLEVIRRLIRLYTNRGEIVLDPFMGIGSTAYVAIEQERRCVGFEIKDSYYAQSLKNQKIALSMRMAQQAPLFSQSSPLIEQGETS